jgi:2-polyprenyl-6-methoxyphenol hydroxylase-like FAD-dependent oxidoreductase
MSLRNDRAIVLGASMAGLLAARALSEHFGQVTLLERDVLPETAEPRRGVPQGRHSHAILARGLQVLEDFFPGLTDELVEEGGVVNDLAHDVLWHLAGGYLAQTPEPSGLLALAVSRPFLEDHVRRRVLALPNVAAIEECDVRGLEADPDDGRIVGVRVGDATSPDQVLSADLVVDATGRGSRLPAWLTSLGYAAPEEERVEVQIGYASRFYRRATPLVRGAHAVIGSSDPGAVRSGLYNAVEDGRWSVTLTGYLGDYPPTDDDGFRAFARSTPTPEIADLIEHAEPLGPAASFRYPASLRRRYERVGHFPEGLIVLGDALCSFNPVYGQGMTVAALEAEALGDCLADGTERLASRFFSRAEGIVDTPWSIATGADLRFPEVQGTRGPMQLFLNWYLRQLQHAARLDPTLGVAFSEVFNLISSPASLLSPTIVWRVARGRVRQLVDTQSTPWLAFRHR